MNKIICIFEKGFRKIALPNGDIINVISCDNGCLITTNNMKKDIKNLNKYIGLPIYEVLLDNNYIEKGNKLEKCKITNHPEYNYKCIVFNTRSTTGDHKIVEVE
ncbi:hypothetical protein ACYJ2U_001686 [Clostridium botulinum]